MNQLSKKNQNLISLEKVGVSMSIKEHGIYSKRAQGLIDHAYRMAKRWHGEQVRKYTGEPYVNHCVEVAQLVASVTECCHMISAALLHDVIEDCHATMQDLRDNQFGFGIDRLVLELTDISVPSDGNRKFRKALDRRYLSRASVQAKTIKLADLISNSKSIIEHDPKFAKTYMAEKELLLDVLREGDEKLYSQAVEIVEQYKRGQQ